MTRHLAWLWLGYGLLAVLSGADMCSAEDARFQSHPAMRALPQPSRRPMAAGPAWFVDAAKGDDGQAGTNDKPWKTVSHALTRLSPGDTLYLRGGVYYETVSVTASGTAEKPLTLRGFPGELAVLDAGFREFAENPAEAWQAAPGGADGEFRSTRTYEYGGGFGNFADSMVPFHRYMNLADLRSANELYLQSLNNREFDPVGMYCGPGTYRDPETMRIHVRLSHTKLAGLGDSAYRGQSDPRKLPLVIAGHDYALRIAGARHVRIADLVLRGAQRSALLVEQCEQIELDGLTLYGSGSALRISQTRGLQLVGSALRGHAAPWHSRFHHKNRAGSGYLLAADGSDFEIAHCELTDHHDAVLLKDADHVRFHHNLVDNFNDDGLEPGPKKPSQHIQIYQNTISRCLNPFTAHGEKTDPVVSEPGSGIYVYRNLIDLRRGTYKSPPVEPDPTGAYLDQPTTLLDHDHGSPTHPDYYVYHNTFLLPGDAMRDYYLWTWAGHLRDTTRRVFNNIFVQENGVPGLNLSAVTADADFIADANLFWDRREGAAVAGEFFAAFRKSPLIEAGKRQYAPGWGASDQFADPRFVAWDEGEKPLDARLNKDSPAVDAGVPLPADWPDPLRSKDAGKPDLGAFPLGVEAAP
jgi:hypothetical protein